MTFVDDPERQCVGKRGYSTKKAAKRSIRRHQQIHNRGTLSAYRCPYCGLFHIGGQNHVAYSTRLRPKEAA